MSQGTYALLGVIVGAVSTAGLEWLRDTLRERRLTRSSGRLVYEELAIAVGRYNSVLHDGAWPTIGAPEYEVETDAWDGAKAHLGGLPQFAVWGTLSIAYQGLDQLGHWARRGADTDLEPHHVERIKEVLKHCTRALDELDPYVGNPLGERIAARLRRS